MAWRSIRLMTRQKWVAEHGKDIGVDGKRLAVAGNSVGGNMAAVVSLMARTKVRPRSNSRPCCGR